MEEVMTVLLSGLTGIFAVVACLLLRLGIGVGLLAVLLVPVLLGVFGYYWLSLGCDRLLALRRVGRLSWRRDSYYTPGHLWMRAMRNQVLRVGADDIARQVLPDI